MLTKGPYVKPDRPKNSVPPGERGKILENGGSMKCHWFPKCTNEATILVPHSLLGDVPTCDRCAAMAVEDADDRAKLKKMDQLLEGNGVLTLNGISTGREVWRDIFEYAQNMKDK